MNKNIQLIENHLWHKISEYEIIAKWRDYEVILHNGIIYRFPRPDKIMDLGLEKKKLDIIAPYITLPIPNFTIVDNSFVTYPAIIGKTFDDCNIIFSDDIITTLARFMKELHSIPVAQFDFMISKNEQTDEEKKWFQDWVVSMKNDVEQRLTEKVPTSTITALHNYMDELFFTYESPVKAFVHTDIQWKNIIYDDIHNTIAGIIDFTDSRIWGIELDFGHFAFKDDWVLEKLVTQYFGHIDPAFIERVEFLAKRGVIFEIIDDLTYTTKFDYLIEQLRRYGFM